MKKRGFSNIRRERSTGFRHNVELDGDVLT